MSTHNICFYGETSKIILYLSQNTLLICCPELSLNALCIMPSVCGVCYFGSIISKGFVSKIVSLLLAYVADLANFSLTWMQNLAAQWYIFLLYM